MLNYLVETAISPTMNASMEKNIQGGIERNGASRFRSKCTLNMTQDYCIEVIVIRPILELLIMIRPCLFPG